MAKIQVFHANNEAFRDLNLSLRSQMAKKVWAHWQAGHYSLVSNVDCVELGDAYARTNNIDNAWIKNEGVTPVYNVPQRSTSVGDILVDNDETVWFVASFGFEKVEEVK